MNSTRQRSVFWSCRLASLRRLLRLHLPGIVCYGAASECERMKSASTGRTTTLHPQPADFDKTKTRIPRALPARWPRISSSWIRVSAVSSTTSNATS